MCTSHSIHVDTGPANSNGDTIADKHGILGAMTGTAAEPPLTPRVETILRMARAEAVSRGHAYTGAEHLMLALLVEGRSVPAQVLAREIPLADVRAALEELMASEGYSGR